MLEIMLAQGNPIDAVTAAQDLLSAFRALAGLEAALIVTFFGLWQYEVSRSRAALELQVSRMRDLNNTLAGGRKDASHDDEGSGA